jgi:hypothetical protein
VFDTGAVRFLRAARSGARTPREQDLIEALSVFFEHFDTLDQKMRTAK